MMLIEKAHIEGAELCLTVPRGEAAKFCYRFRPGEYEITPAKKKRSLDANSYLWKLCTEISGAVGVTKEEVYRNAIQQGNEYIQLDLTGAEAEELARTWPMRGTGWFTEIVDYSDRPGRKMVFAYKGSSVYDTRQMAALIDRVVQDCKALDIETLGERELSLLKDAWK